MRDGRMDGQTHPLIEIQERISYVVCRARGVELRDIADEKNTHYTLIQTARQFYDLFFSTNRWSQLTTNINYTGKNGKYGQKM